MRKVFGRVLAAALLITAASCDNASNGKEAAAAGGGAAKAGKTNWVEVTARTPEGGFLMGNPNAKVKLIEFASLTCPHCKDFHAAAMDTIKTKYVASGNVSFEFRNFVLNGPDYAVSILARCQGPGPFFGLLGAFFKDQSLWIEPFTTLSPADQARLQALPQDKQIAALAEAGKLDGYVRTRGIPRAKFDACLANKAEIDTIAKLRTQATETYKLTGTPGFIINGKTQEGVFDWRSLEPKLQAALQ